MKNFKIYIKTSCHKNGSVNFLLNVSFCVPQKESLIGLQQHESSFPGSYSFNPVVLNRVPTLHVIFLNQTHLIQATPRPGMDVSDKGDIQNVECWEGFRIMAALIKHPFVFCRYVSKSGRAEHLRSSQTGRKHWPAPQTTQTRPAEAFTTIQSQAPINAQKEPNGSSSST